MDQYGVRTAVVTGAGGGIGNAICRSLVAAGFRVLGLDKKLPEDEMNCSDNVPANLHLRQCDITQLEEVASAFQWVEERLGGTDVLVNCAGFSSIGHITEVGDKPISDADIANTYDVNIKAMVFCTRHAVKSMKNRAVDGHIININSIAGHYVPFTDLFNVYSSSKYAVTSFTASLANEMAAFGSKIKTTSVSPGMVRTRLSSSFIGDAPALAPQDVADAVVYVLSTPPHVNITELKIQPVAETRM